MGEGFNRALFRKNLKNASSLHSAFLKEILMRSMSDKKQIRLVSGFQIALWGWMATMMAVSPLSLADKSLSSQVGSRMKMFVAPTIPHVQKIAVMPFKAPHQKAREVMTAALTRELQRTFSYTLVDQAKISNELGLSQIALPLFLTAKPLS